MPDIWPAMQAQLATADVTAFAPRPGNPKTFGAGLCWQLRPCLLRTAFSRALARRARGKKHTLEFFEDSSPFTIFVQSCAQFQKIILTAEHRTGHPPDKCLSNIIVSFLKQRGRLGCCRGEIRQRKPRRSGAALMLPAAASAPLRFRALLDASANQIWNCHLAQRPRPDGFDNLHADFRPGQPNAPHLTAPVQFKQASPLGW